MEQFKHVQAEGGVLDPITGITVTNSEPICPVSYSPHPAQLFQNKPRVAYHFSYGYFRVSLLKVIF